MEISHDLPGVTDNTHNCEESHRHYLGQTGGLSVPSDNILPISHHASCLLPPSEATTTGLLSLDCGRKFSIMSVIIVVVHLLGARAVCVPGVAQFGILDGQTAGIFNTSNISSQRTIGNIKLLSSVKQLQVVCEVKARTLQQTLSNVQVKHFSAFVVTGTAAFLVFS